MTQLCGSFRKEAGRVWRQMEAAGRLGLALSEETLTETCLYNIAKKHQHDGIALYPATKPEEHRHGADWEWWFTQNGRGVGYRVQAKRLFPSGRYQSLFKTNNPLSQLKKLVAKAKKDGLDPLYCFYNFDCPPKVFHGWNDNCPHAYRGPSFWGCTIALPQDIEKAAVDGVETLREVMVPWHSLVCIRSSSNLPDSVLANVRRMAAQRLTGAIRREALAVATQPQELPAYVSRLVKLGRSRREGAADTRGYLDFDYWNEPTASKKEISGIIVLDDRR